MKTPHLMNRLTAKFILRSDAPSANGNPVSLQAFINGTPCVVAMNITIPPVNWDKQSQRCIYVPGERLSKKTVQEYNDMLIHRMNRVNEIRHHYEMTDRDLTKSLFLWEFKNDTKRNGFISFVETELEQLKANSELSTYRHYLVSVRRLQEFSPNMRFADLSAKLLDEYTAWLKTKHKLGVNTIWRHHKDFRKFINLGISRGIPIKNPYVGYKLLKVKGNPEWLQPEELKKLLHVFQERSLSDELQTVLRYYLFCCYTGLRISDVTKLTVDNVIGNELVFIMRKNRKKQKQMRVPLNATANKLIMLTDDDRKLFKTYADPVTNRYLKTICTEVGLRRKLTFHSSRHTFAMMFLDKGGKVEVLQKILGHSKLETTEIYVHLRTGALREQINYMDDPEIIQGFDLKVLL